MAQARRFFALPEERKRRLDISLSPAHRGYFPYFAENNDPANNRDLKEGFDLARDLPPDDPRVLAAKPLAWLERLAGRPARVPRDDRGLLRGTRRTGRPPDGGVRAQPAPAARVFPADAERGHGGTASVALSATAGGWRGPGGSAPGPHTDYGCLTILAQDSVGGLQVRNAAGEWVAAPPVPGAFVVNIGDQMARWTNDVFAATHHRVINLSGRERYSMPFFFEPNYDAVISCLDTCRSADHPAKYADVVAGEYLLSRFNDTFSYLAKEVAV